MRHSNRFKYARIVTAFTVAAMGGASANDNLPARCATIHHVDPAKVITKPLRGAEMKIPVWNLERTGKNTIRFRIKKDDAPLWDIFFNDTFGLHERKNTRGGQLCPSFQISSLCYDYKKRNGHYIVTVKIPPTVLKDVLSSKCVIGPKPHHNDYASHMRKNTRHNSPPRKPFSTQ